MPYRKTTVTDQFLLFGESVAKPGDTDTDLSFAASLICDWGRMLPLTPSLKTLHFVTVARQKIYWTAPTDLIVIG